MPAAFAAPPAAPRAAGLAESFAYCERLTRDHYENFPVGSMLLPRRLRRHVCAIYAFARTADDFADEARYEGERLERLADWRAQLDACARGLADGPVFAALAETIGRFDVPVELLHDLITAFEMDCRNDAWPDWDSLLHYCRYSANPVGRLVLWLSGYRDEGRAELSDAVCTALQLTNFWQDVSVDLAKGRVYIPEADQERFGYMREDLEAGRRSDRLTALMLELVSRTRKVFDLGRPLSERVRGRLRYELRLTWLGGRAILDAVEASGYDVLRRPTIRKRQWAGLLLRAILGRGFWP